MCCVLKGRLFFLVKKGKTSIEEKGKEKIEIFMGRKYNNDKHD